VCNPWPGSLNLVAGRKVQILKQALRFLKGIANLPWMAIEQWRIKGGADWATARDLQHLGGPQSLSR